jgi:hypothetical protein
MPLLQRIAALVVGLAIFPASIAGTEKESYSARRGLFFAWLSPDDGYVLARLGRPDELHALARHCNSGRDVFSLQGGTKYKCKFEMFKLPSGVEDWESAGATVQGPSPKSDTRQFGLFSTISPRTAKWTVRKISPQELGAVDSLIQSDARLVGTIKRQLKLSTASVVGRPDGSSFTVVAPGAIVQDKEAYYSAQRHHVFVQRDGMYSYLGEVPGKPIKYVDIDGNDLPGLVVSEGCDGWCISLWGLTDGLQQLGTFGGH